MTRRTRRKWANYETNPFPRPAKWANYDEGDQPRTSQPRPAQALVGHDDGRYALIMIPIVIDTNVFVAALRSAGGALRAILRELLREYP